MDIKLKEILDQSMNRGTLNPDHIPDLDLYIDQIIMLMEMHVGKQEDGQPPLTRTMIHNYSKAGLISPVKGKKYSKEHIMQMFAIYSLKNTLSIAQIKRVLCALDEEEGDVLHDCYNAYLNQREALCEDTRSRIEKIMDGIEQDDHAKLYTTLLLLSDAAQMLTDFTRLMTETCYPEPPVGKKKEKEK